MGEDEVDIGIRRGERGEGGGRDELEDAIRKDLGATLALTLRAY